jgi:hypothetical protein
MSEKILDVTEEAEEPTSADEFTAKFLQDLILNEDPDILASDFIDEFVLTGRPEAAQILGLIEMPTENLIGLVKELVVQGYHAQNQAIDNHGVQYLDGLKAAVRAQMTELAEQ